MASCRGWHRCRRRLRKALHDESGQSTVEFCLVAAAFLAVILGGWAMLQAFSAGQLADHAVSSAAHVLEASPTGVLADIFAV